MASIYSRYGSKPFEDEEQPIGVKVQPQPAARPKTYEQMLSQYAPSGAIQVTPNQRKAQIEQGFGSVSGAPVTQAEEYQRQLARSQTNQPVATQVAARGQLGYLERLQGMQSQERMASEQAKTAQELAQARYVTPAEIKAKAVEGAALTRKEIEDAKLAYKATNDAADREQETAITKMNIGADRDAAAQAYLNAKALQADKFQQEGKLAEAAAVREEMPDKAKKIGYEKRTVSSYDTAGRKTGERESWVPIQGEQSPAAAAPVVPTVEKPGDAAAKAILANPNATAADRLAAYEHLYGSAKA